MFNKITLTLLACLAFSASANNTLRFTNSTISIPNLNNTATSPESPSDIQHPTCSSEQPIVTIEELRNMISTGEDVTNVCTSNITNMDNLFNSQTTFNQDISNWDVSKVTSMAWMFYHADSFNQDLSKWDTSNVQSMHSMFRHAYKFNQNIGEWNVSNVTTMEYMFYKAYDFSQDLSNWNVSNVTGTRHFHTETGMTNEQLPAFN